MSKKENDQRQNYFFNLLQLPNYKELNNRIIIANTNQLIKTMSKRFQNRTLLAIIFHLLLKEIK